MKFAGIWCEICLGCMTCNVCLCLCINVQVTAIQRGCLSEFMIISWFAGVSYIVERHVWQRLPAVSVDIDRQTILDVYGRCFFGTNMPTLSRVRVG